MRRLVGPLAVLLCLNTLACRERKPENLAEAASALASAAPAPATATPLAIETGSSRVSFLMEAPIEKISGEAPASVEGELFVDLADVTKSVGLVRVDLDKLTLFQERRDDEKGAFGERKKNDLQNEHARNWLEIASDVPEDARKANRFVEFSVLRVEDASTKNVAEKGPGEHKIRATVVGNFRLHGRKNEKRAAVELTFKTGAAGLESLAVKSVEPLRIGLEEYDVKPREAFGKLAQKTLGALGSKVATSAPVMFEFTARAK